MVTITDDIIRKALNESIDEFIINESGAWDSVKNWATKWGLDKAWNGIKNFAAEYMDKKTNGQWNRKYNIQAKGKGAFVGTFYMEKWLTERYRRLYDIIYGNYYGDRRYFYTELNGRNYSFMRDWKNGYYVLTDRNTGNVYKMALDENKIPNILTIEDYNGTKTDESIRVDHNKIDGSHIFKLKSGEDVEIYVGEDNTTPEAYIAKNCTPNSFVNNFRNTLEDGNFRKLAINYIDSKIQAENNKNIEKLRKNPEAPVDYNSILKLFTMNGFLTWYYENKDNIQDDNQQQPQPNNGNDPGQAERNAANQNVQGAQMHYALATDGSITDSKKPRRAF